MIHVDDLWWWQRPDLRAQRVVLLQKAPERDFGHPDDKQRWARADIASVLHIQPPQFQPPGAPGRPTPRQYTGLTNDGSDASVAWGMSP